MTESDATPYKKDSREKGSGILEESPSSFPFPFSSFFWMLCNSSLQACKIQVKKLTWGRKKKKGSLGVSSTEVRRRVRSFFFPFSAIFFFSSARSSMILDPSSSRKEALRKEEEGIKALSFSFFSGLEAVSQEASRVCAASQCRRLETAVAVRVRESKKFEW